MAESLFAEAFDCDELHDEELDRGGLKFCCGGCVGASG